mmetsp:Transcript_11768/g.30134  ORF Transcript_11768/g.30134 Transcript_11768/m.30134 type:complete len:127 (-) Transcript_11768:9-389(-)
MAYWSDEDDEDRLYDWACNELSDYSDECSDDQYEYGDDDDNGYEWAVNHYGLQDHEYHPTAGCDEPHDDYDSEVDRLLERYEWDDGAGNDYNTCDGGYHGDGAYGSSAYGYCDDTFSFGSYPFGGY